MFGKIQFQFQAMYMHIDNYSSITICFVRKIYHVVHKKFNFVQGRREGLQVTDRHKFVDMDSCDSENAKRGIDDAK